VRRKDKLKRTGALKEREEGESNHGLTRKGTRNSPGAVHGLRIKKNKKNKKG
jgi:hypothetical protein